MSKKLKQLLDDYGAKTDRRMARGHSDSEDTLFMTQSFYDAKRMTLEATARVNESEFFGSSHTLSDFSEHALDSHAGSLEEFKKALETGEVPDFAKFSAALAAMDRTLSSKLQESIGQGFARVRQWNEYDGELDTTRLDADKPFLRRTNAMTTVRTINIEYHIAASYRLSNEDLTKFGAMVFAVIKTLETNGVLCRVTIVKHNSHAWQNSKTTGGVHLTYVIKEAGQYISDADLAFACHMMFYRKLAWANFALLADAVVGGKGVKAPIGGTNPLREAVKYDAESNTLRFSMNQLEIADSLVREILTALSTDTVALSNLAS